MEIQIYSKPGCDKCQSAKEKLNLMGFAYSEHNLEYHTELHEGWREDGSVEALAAHTLYNTLPLFRIENDFLDYPGAMRVLKKLRRK